MIGTGCGCMRTIGSRSRRPKSAKELQFVRDNAERIGGVRRIFAAPHCLVHFGLEPICSFNVLFCFLQVGRCDMSANHVIVME